MSTVVSLPFRGGLDEGVDPKDPPAGTLSVAKNVQQDRDGRLSKRNALTALSTLNHSGGSALAGDAIFSSPRGGLVVNRPTTRTSLVLAETAGRWADGPVMSNASCTWRKLLSTVGGAMSVNCAYHPGRDLLVVVYTSHVSGTATPGIGSINIRVDHVTSGATVFGPYEVALSSLFAVPQVIVLNDTALLMWETTATLRGGATLSLTDFTYTSKNSGDSTALDNGGVFGGTFAMATDGTEAVIVQYLSGGAPDLRANVVDDTFTDVRTADVNLTARGTFLGIACDWPSGGDVLVVTSNSSTPTTDLAVLDASTLAVSATAQVGANASRVVSVKNYNGTDCVVAWSRHSTAGTDSVPRATFARRHTISTAAVVANTETRTYQATLASQLWIDSNARPHAVLGIGGAGSVPQRNVVAVFDVTADASRVATQPATVAGMLAYEHNLVPPIWGWTFASYDRIGPAQVAKVTQDRALFACGAYTPTGTQDQLQAPVYDLVTFETGVSPPGCTYQGRLFTGGAVPATPHVKFSPGCGFPIVPTIYSLVDNGGGTGTMAAGSYGYVVVLKWVAPDGTTHRSEPSPQVTVSVAGATSSVNVTVRTMPLGGRYWPTSAFTSFQPVMVEVYRTTLAGGTTVRLVSVPPVGTFSELQTGAQEFTIVDANGDGDIAGLGIALSSQPQVYTSTGELPPTSPPSFTAVTEHRGRIVGVAGDEHTLWFSKDTGEDSSLAPEFSPVLTLSFPTKVKALGTLDGRLVVFHSDSISAVTGDGPDSNGNANNWVISDVHADSGCLVQESVAVFPGGLLFKGRRTIELLGRDLSVKEVGRQVVQALTDYPTIVAAVTVPSASQVRWLCNNAADTAGIILVFDYLHGSWYTWSVHDGQTAGVALRDATLHGGVFYALTKTPRVVKEDSTTSYENSNWVQMDVELAWFGGKNKWSRVARAQLLGTSVTPHRLTMTHSVNYSASAEQTKTWVEGSDVTNVGVLEKAQLTLKTQRAHAHKIRIYDAIPSDTGTYPVGTGKGPILEGLALTVTELPNLPYASQGRKG